MKGVWGNIRLFYFKLFSDILSYSTLKYFLLIKIIPHYVILSYFDYYKLVHLKLFKLLLVILNHFTVGYFWIF
jgi:hypothetical protein